MKTKVWFNHWFSTAYHFINSLKKEGYYVFATNERDTCVYGINADEFYIEPVFDNGEAYVEWALDFATKHSINIFFVRRYMDAVVDNIELFENKGIKVICPKDKAMFHLLNDKKASNEFIASINACKTPELMIVNTAEEFKIAYETMKEKYRKVCIKYNQDEGGQSYKLIGERKPNMGRISENNGLVYTYDYVYECLKTEEKFKDLIVMPYLEGPEVSVDCLNTSKGLVAVARFKLSNRVTLIETPDDLMEIAENIAKHTKLNAPFNIQLRKHNGEWYFLEVNTRLSGGSWKAGYVGIDFAKLAVKDIMDEIEELPKAISKSLKLSNIENCIILN